MGSISEILQRGKMGQDNSKKPWAVWDNPRQMVFPDIYVYMSKITSYMGLWVMLIPTPILLSNKQVTK